MAATTRSKTLMVKFKYDGKSYNMTTVEMAHMFGVNYDRVYAWVSKHKLPMDEIVKLALELGGNYPMKQKLMNNILYKSGLVPASD